jgi:hypothetical protein
MITSVTEGNRTSPLGDPVSEMDFCALSWVGRESRRAHTDISGSIRHFGHVGIDGRLILKWIS